MNDYIADITLDLNCERACQTVSLTQFDKGKRLRFTVTSNNSPYSLTGCDVVLKGEAPNGTRIAVDCQVENDGTATVMTDDFTFPVNGFAQGQLVISDSERSYYTQKFRLFVDNALDFDVHEDGRYSILDRLIRQVNLIDEHGGIIVDDELSNSSTHPVQNKVIAQALNGYYRVNTTDQQPDYATCDAKTIYVGAKLGNERGIIIPFFGKDKQMFIGANGTICVRHYTGGNDYQDWEPNLSELTANKKTAINSSNQSSTDFFPSIKAVVDYLTANYTDTTALNTLLNTKADVTYVDNRAEEVGDLKSAIDLMTEWKYKSFCPLTFHQGRLDTSNRPVTIDTTNTYFVYTDYVDISAVPLNDKLYFVAPSGINVLGFMASSTDNNPANSVTTGWKNGTVYEWTKTSNAFKYFAISAYISYSVTFTPEQAASSGIGVYQIAESVDDVLSANSENPVQNKVVNTALNDLRGILMSSQVPVSYTKTDNKYINFNSGMVVSIASAFSYSSPITVNKGDIISIPAETDSDGIARLAKVITQDSLYEGLVNSALTRNSQYYYVVTEDCQVAFCGRTKNLPWFKVYHGIMIKSILDAANNGIINLKKTASTIHPSGGQILYKGDTAVNSGHLVNALAYDNGVIIGARSDGKIVRIGYDGIEETLLSLNGSNMDWRCLFKDSSGNVYASPHATFGSLQMTDRGLYRLSGTTLAWVDLEHPSWETGAIRSAHVGNAIQFNPDASAFRHTFAQVTTGDTVRIRVYTTASTVNIYGAFTDDNNIVISSPTEYFPTDQVAAFRDLPSLTVPTGATRLHIMTYTQSGWESECRIQAYQTTRLQASSFVKVISLYDPSSSVQTETEENNDTIWTMCEDDNGNLYAGAYAHTTHANPAIYKSTDGGLTWNYLFNFNSAGLTSNGRHIHSIVYSKWQKALYCIVGEVNTIFKSIDGGESWVNLNVVLNVKGTVMLPTPSGIIIGSDGAYNLFIDVLENDDTTHYNVFTGWANTVFALRLSDITGFVYAFTKIDSAVNNVNYYPPISALTDPSAITTWQNSVPAATFDAWSNYRNSVLSEYPDDAIRPQHYAILVSRNGGGTWEVLRRWKCPSNGAYGFITTGQFLNGECITGLYNELGFVNPIIISEGKHKYISGGCDLDGEIFVRTNASSTVTVL